MPFYWTLLRIDRAKTNTALKGLKALPKKSSNPGTKVYYVGNVFGEWDGCIWYEANDHEHAMEFVQNKLSSIPGVTYTYTLPTTPIQEYYKEYWKD